MSSDQKTDTSPAEVLASTAADHRADEAIIPHGALDPVYEAKARVLNRAVRVRRRPAPPSGVPLIQEAAERA